MPLARFRIRTLMIAVVVVGIALAGLVALSRAEDGIALLFIASMLGMIMGPAFIVLWIAALDRKVD